NMILILFLLSFMMMSLGTIAWTERSAESKLQTIPGVNILHDNVQWTVKSGDQGKCLVGNVYCKNALAESPELYHGANLEELTWKNETKSEEPRWLLLSTTFSKTAWQGLDPDKVWILSLPRFDFENVWVYFD